MAIKKRGLGRGLEALLVDVPVTEDISQQPSPSTGIANTRPVAFIEKPEAPQRIEETNTQYASTLIEILRKENANLLQEAESLKKLINELTDIIERL